MPTPYSSETHQQPAVNVNPKPCDCGGKWLIDPHHGSCAGRPIPIPCPIPRSVNFDVVLGACTCGEEPGRLKPLGSTHVFDCPAHPVRVSCSISGSTWEESEVVDAWPDREDGYLCSTGEEFPTLMPLCRDRWALVKALVLGRGVTFHHGSEIDALLKQRDSAYAVLADMARAEEAHQASRHALFAAIPAIFPRGGVSPRPIDERPSALNLSAYVSHLIEQIGSTP